MTVPEAVYAPQGELLDERLVSRDALRAAEAIGDRRLLDASAELLSARREHVRGLGVGVARGRDLDLGNGRELGAVPEGHPVGRLVGRPEQNPRPTESVCPHARTRARLLRERRSAA
jgi:hypothetical protein